MHTQRLHLQHEINMWTVREQQQQQQKWIERTSAKSIDRLRKKAVFVFLSVKQDKLFELVQFLFVCSFSSWLKKLKSHNFVLISV